MTLKGLTEHARSLIESAFQDIYRNDYEWCTLSPGLLQGMKCTGWEKGLQKERTRRWEVYSCTNSANGLCMHVCRWTGMLGLCVGADSCRCLQFLLISMTIMPLIYMSIKRFPTAVISKSGHWARGRQHLFGQIETRDADLHFGQIIGTPGSVWVGRSLTELTVNCSCKAEDTIWLWLC